VAPDGPVAVELADRVHELQPQEELRSVTPDLRGGRRRARLEARAPHGSVRIDVMLATPRIANESAEFDEWYDAGTPEADLVVYSGHAAHGDNVRALMTKGAFRAGQYTVWVVNGCDTLAYVDGTLARRRSALNPDDPMGTKYMDTVSNVLGGWFHTGAETTMQFVRELVAGGDPASRPKTYPEIFASIDRDQVVVVTGEEDNEYVPSRSAVGPATAPTGPAPPVARGDDEAAAPPQASRADAAQEGAGGCSVTSERRGSGRSRPLAFAVFVLLAARRAIRRGAAACQSRTQ
jgi:hypothetical protein